MTVMKYDDAILCGPTELYYVKDSWESFDRLKPVLDRRVKEWKATRSLPSNSPATFAHLLLRLQLMCL
jgi:hypothetical protein